MKNPMTRYFLVLTVGLTLAGGMACSNSGGFQAAGHALVSVSSCYDVKNYLAEMATEQLLGSVYYWDWGWRVPGIQFDEAVDGSSGINAPTDFTTTNVQEEGVDEADIVECDGEYLYLLHDQDLIIARSWPPENTTEVARVSLDGYAQSMFLHQNRVVVFSQDYDDYYWSTGTRITLVDVSNRQNPQILRQVEVDGWMASARAIDGQVYLVLQSHMDFCYREEFQKLTEDIKLDWWNDTYPELARRAARIKLYPKVRRLIDSIPLAEILPAKLEGDSRTALTRCQDLYRPMRIVQPGIATVVSFDMNDVQQPVGATGVLGGGMQVYASKQNIYLAQSSWAWMWWENDDHEIETHVHKLALDPEGGAPAYQASGAVSGWLLNQFSMSEHGDTIRMATTETTWSNDQGGNNVFVLKQAGAELVEFGGLRGLSPDEQIYAARFLGDRAYLVTFQQIDPLHTIDLSDPANPRELGQLEVPGFSTYLHPFDEGYLLAIGNDGNWNVQLSLFDVRDPYHPTRAHEVSISVGDWGSYSEAMYDHHAFTYHPERHILAIPVNTYHDNDYFTGAMVYRVTVENGFELLGRVDHSDLARAADCPEWYSEQQDECYQDYHWWVSMLRTVFIEDSIYSISSAGLSVDELVNPSAHQASLVF